MLALLTYIHPYIRSQNINRSFKLHNLILTEKFNLNCIKEVNLTIRKTSATIMRIHVKYPILSSVKSEDETKHVNGEGKIACFIDSLLRNGFCNYWEFILT